MKRSTIEILQLKVRRGGFADSFPDRIMFSTPSAAKGKVHYFSLRIGRGIAERAGFRPGDKVKVEFDDETREGWISPDKNGRVLITGDPKVPDCPPVIYKQTWAEDMPSIAQRTALEEVAITSSMHIKFRFPEGTSFTTLADGTHTKRVTLSELYQDHEELVERSGSGKGIRRTRKDEPKKALERRCITYGRRATDRKDC